MNITLIHGTIIFPILFVAWMLIWHRKEIHIWEIVLQFTVCIGAIFISSLIVDTMGTNDTEYWGNLGTQIQYDEPWNELVHYTVQVPNGTR